MNGNFAYVSSLKSEILKSPGVFRHLNADKESTNFQQYKLILK